MAEDKTVKVKVPGTTANCGPGFDSLGIACNLYNELELTLRKKGNLVIEIRGEGAQNIPCDGRNVVWKSIQYLLQRADLQYQGAYIKMLNRVPLSRGLGSSAAAIVAGLTAANYAIGNRFTSQEIFAMATDIEGHPDNVAPAIFGGMTLSILRKDGKPECLSFFPKIDLQLIVTVPEFSLSTKAARKVLPAVVPLKDAVFNIGRAALLVGALCEGKTEFLEHAFEDCLHQPYREKLIPGMYDVFAAAVQSGALGAAMSGAGPCLIAFTENNGETIGKAMVEAFQKHDIKAKYLLLTIDKKGACLL